MPQAAEFDGMFRTRFVTLTDRIHFKSWSFTRQLRTSAAYF
jgi:hypothetical protein